MFYYRAQLFCVFGMIGGDFDYSAVGLFRGDVVGYVYLVRRVSEFGVIRHWN
jgi:hypothetical protein